MHVRFCGPNTLISLPVCVSVRSNESSIRCRLFASCLMFQRPSFGYFFRRKAGRLACSTTAETGSNGTEDLDSPRISLFMWTCLALKDGKGDDWLRCKTATRSANSVASRKIKTLAPCLDGESARRISKPAHRKQIAGLLAPFYEALARTARALESMGGQNRAAASVRRVIALVVELECRHFDVLQNA